MEKLAHTDSSSDEEISVDALKEATDCNFLNESLFSTKKEASSAESNIKRDDQPSLKSLRSDINRSEKFENFGVSQSFKDFIAKKLDSILDKSIKIKNTTNEILDNKAEDRSRDFGIKLLSNSKQPLSDNEEVEEKVLRKKPKQEYKMKKVCLEDNTSDLQKLQEAAVSPEWILSKEDTKAWVNRRSDLQFKYKKLKNGILVEQT